MLIRKAIEDKGGKLPVYIKEINGDKCFTVLQKTGDGMYLCRDSFGKETVLTDIRNIFEHAPPPPQLPS